MQTSVGSSSAQSIRAGDLLARLWAARPEVRSTRLTLLLAVVLATGYNVNLWAAVMRIRPLRSAADLGFLLSFLLLVITATWILLNAVGFRFIQKPFSVLFVLISACVGYFMSAYGVMIDREMIRNIVETDPGEVQELLSARLFFHVLVFGVAPAILICRTRVVYRRFMAQLALAMGAMVVGLGIIAAIAGLYYADYASMLPVHRHLRHLAVPFNYTYALGKYAASRAREESGPLRPLGEDAVRRNLDTEGRRRRLVILVVGETARASSFSLNGYDRPTNPRLESREVISFREVMACGTSTAVALPCMFSASGRASFDAAREKSSENLLDVLNYAGIDLLWRDNNSGCKGVCDRVEAPALESFADRSHCDDDGCVDEVLLDNLDRYLDRTTSDVVVVLHQNGSHGPSYYLRYPQEFARFVPGCTTSSLQDCGSKRLVNSYDNTILYTDHVLDQVIRFLEGRSDRFETAMIYLSDHGESLGEDQLYLHGLPYILAPDVQKRVPLILWLSKALQQSGGVDPACLESRNAEHLTQDNLFHSVLGLMDVETRVYDPALDIFAGCRTRLDR